MVDTVTKYECTQCSFEGDSLEELKEHYIKEHLSESDYLYSVNYHCGSCDTGYSDEDEAEECCQEPKEEDEEDYIPF